MNQTKSHAETRHPDSTGSMSFENVWWRHAAPFIAWLFLMQMLGDPAGWKYGVRSVICLALFIALRPWRGYDCPRWRTLPITVAAGVFVFALWVAPETRVFARFFPKTAQSYLRWAVMPFGRMPAPVTASPYAPENVGWLWAAIRLAGSAGVIAIIEEFFWHGFLYRWMFAREFMNVDLGRWNLVYFLLVNFVFGLEHDRWLAGWLAGMVYGALVLRTRNIWTAVFAHATTNYFLGLYVLATGHYSFW